MIGWQTSIDNTGFIRRYLSRHLHGHVDCFTDGHDEMGRLAMAVNTANMIDDFKVCATDSKGIVPGSGMC